MKGRCYNPSTKQLHSISQVGTSIQVETTEVYPVPSVEVLTEFLFIGSELHVQELKSMLDNCLQMSDQNKLAY
ncbi:GTP-binding protein [Bacillus sp. JCM 19034]|uniref:GTP-binding protein n=1 Tax=Bacillus sp. JCM 19034 TaxID=1481928 RepID=UPI0007847599|nr:GTP-binding protein [Bacillus sp. JCM 19034]